jgi:hypothetical protein
MTKYSLTKSLNADNVVAVSKDLSAIPIEVTKNTGSDTVTFRKNAAIKVKLVKQGGSSLIFYPPVNTYVAETNLPLDPVAGFETPETTCFAKNGTRFYNLESTSSRKRTHQYDMSTGWNVSTGTFQFTRSPGTISEGRGIFMRADGKQLWWTGPSNIVSYTLNTAYELSDGMVLDGSFAPGAELIGTMGDINIDPTGTILIVADTDVGGINAGKLLQYSMSPWGIATLSYVKKSTNTFTVDTGEGFRPCYIPSDGTQFWHAWNTVRQYTITNPWDVGDIVNTGYSRDVRHGSQPATGVTFSDDAQKMYITCRNTDYIYQYTQP